MKVARRVVKARTPVWIRERSGSIGAKIVNLLALVVEWCLCFRVLRHDEGVKRREGDDAAGFTF